jgi:hypothetical protein
MNIPAFSDTLWARYSSKKNGDSGMSRWPEQRKNSSSLVQMSGTVLGPIRVILRVDLSVKYQKNTLKYMYQRDFYDRFSLNFWRINTWVRLVTDATNRKNLWLGAQVRNMNIFSLGDRVEHKKFGIGTIVSLTGDVAQIAFSSGIKSLNIRIAPLTKR